MSAEDYKLGTPEVSSQHLIVQEHNVDQMSPHRSSERTQSSQSKSADRLSVQYAKKREPSVRNALILHHQHLVHYVVARFVGMGESVEDLVQVGNIGLINALDRYDPNRDIKFSTYAMPTIVGEIKRYFRDKTWHVKVPRWLQELSFNARKSQQILTFSLGRQPTVREIASDIGVDEHLVLEAMELARGATAISLDTRLDSKKGLDSPTLVDIIGRSDSALDDFENHSDLEKALNVLDDREYQVIHLRFFEELSQAKIASKLGISQMHVSRLQHRALHNLKSQLLDHEPRNSRRRRAALNNSKDFIRPLHPIRFS